MTVADAASHAARQGYIMASKLALLILLSIAPLTVAHALGGPTFGGPSTGLWARQGDGGRGFNIDIQGDLMTVTTFVYTQTGQPIWYLSSGFFNHDTGRFQSTYDSYSDGQCFGCPPDQPVVHAGAAGNMSIQFHDNQSATITTPGGSINIQKFNYGFATVTDLLYGEWLGSFNAGGLVGGDWMLFGYPFEDGGTVYAAGNLDGDTDALILGTYVADTNTVLILAGQSNSSYFHWYSVGMDDRRGAGEAWVLPDDELPSGNGVPAFLSRILYESEITFLDGTTSPAGALPPNEAYLAGKSACTSDCRPRTEFDGMRGVFEKVRLEKRARLAKRTR
jgi:hypothetical protein